MKTVRLGAETLDLLARILEEMDHQATRNVIHTAKYPALCDHSIRFAATIATARAELGFLK
jgi:hypothetical protein